jgi:hypothetical protein
MEKLDIPKTAAAEEGSSSTLSYNAWNSKSLVNWQDFEEVTGPSHAGPPRMLRNLRSRKKKRRRMVRTPTRMRTPMRSDLGT